MVLKAIYDKQEDVPEAYRELYAERDGKFELSGIEGIKTQADVDRLATALTKERTDHKATKDRLAAWGDLKPDETRTQLDRIPELEAQADKVDDEKLDKLFEARTRTKLAPVERERDGLKTKLEEALGKVAEFETKERVRAIHDAVRSEAMKSKVVESALDDVLMVAERVFEVSEDGWVKTRDGMGVTPGIAASDWLSEMQPKRPHWWPASEGGGARPGGGGTAFPNNPWGGGESWNVTEQMRVVKTLGPERAEQMAKAAGTTVGGPRPQPKQ